MRTSVVTGANRGLGFEVARALAAAGHRVVLTGRDASAVARAADELGALGRTLDVTSAESREAFAEWARAELGQVDVLVNNAGVSLDGFDAAVAEQTLEANYRAPLRVTDLLTPLLSSRANVVMVSSGMGELSCVGPELRRAFAAPELGRDELEALARRFVADVERGDLGAGWPRNAYRVSKLALNAATRILARELTGRARVNAVCPGWVRTRMGGRSASRSAEEGARGIVWAALIAEDGPSGGFFRDGVAIEW